MSSDENWQAKVCMDSIQGKIQRVRALHNKNNMEANHQQQPGVIEAADDAHAEQSPFKLL